jgi:hypothetical protein
MRLPASEIKAGSIGMRYPICRLHQRQGTSKLGGYWSPDGNGDGNAAAGYDGRKEMSYQLEMFEQRLAPGPREAEPAAEALGTEEKDQRRPAFSRVTGLWVPRQFVTESGVEVRRFLADVNAKIRSRGFINYDRNSDR